ncbi:multi antimicrobial extrusion protein MatE [Cohnella cellulosilytica]
MSKLFGFFLPLGFSASLVTISHIIINSTLARATNAETIIASYAIAISLMTIMDRPLFLLRQTCSILVRDRRSFRSMWAVSAYVIGAVLFFGAVMSYTPLGRITFTWFYGVTESRLAATLDAYRILMFACIFSGIRCLYHGIIISHMRTKWMTIGMAIRLVGMYALSQWYIQTGRVDSGEVGAIIFLVGMFIECLVCFLEGNRLAGKLPPVNAERPPVTQSDIFKFYRPILYSSFIALFIGPIINAYLGRTVDVELAIASYAIASSLMLLVTSFFSYTHQIVLNFYRVDRTVVNKFVWILSVAPTLLVAVICYTDVGVWFMANVMGVEQNLMSASLQALRVFMIFTLVFPWLDYVNGLVMLNRKTKIMVWSQGSNVLITFLILISCIAFAPRLNGTMGSLAQSFGYVAEFGVVMAILRFARNKK